MGPWHSAKVEWPIDTVLRETHQGSTPSALQNWAVHDQYTSRSKLHLTYGSVIARWLPRNIIWLTGQWNLNHIWVWPGEHDPATVHHGHMSSLVHAWEGTFYHTRMPARGPMKKKAMSHNRKKMDGVVAQLGNAVEDRLNQNVPWPILSLASGLQPAHYSTI